MAKLVVKTATIIPSDKQNKATYSIQGEQICKEVKKAKDDPAQTSSLGCMAGFKTLSQRVLSWYSSLLSYIPSRYLQA